MRVVLVGGPRTGKTTGAKKLGAARELRVRNTDDLIATHGWSEASSEVAQWMSEGGSWVIEGVATVRALRKWLASNPAPAVPADHIVWLEKAFVPRTAPQEGMAKGVATVWKEIEPELRRRGVRITSGVHTMDLGVGDVHTAGAMGGSAPARFESPAEVVRRVTTELLGATEKEAAMSVSAAKRKSIPEGEFALPELRKYPIDTAARTRNAAARLEQMRKRGLVSESQYKEAKGRIGKAAKKFGIDSEYQATDAAPPDGRSRVPGTLHIRADLAPGGALHVRHHMSDRPFFDIEGVLLASDAAVEDKPVWIQLAKQGAFAGHPSGPFRLDLKTFNEIIANFKATTNRAIPVDYEHASEQDPTSGTIPISGSPAQGWVREMEIRDGNLWGLVDWLPQARDQIRSGAYRFLSPAIRFDSTDRVTGRKVGARLTSCGLTNLPFLDGMEPLAAKDGASTAAAATAATVVALKGGHLDRPVHSPHEYMPALKAALKLGPLATHAECADQLARVRECCMKVGHDGMHDGVPMGDYTRPLMSMVGAAPGMTVEELFDTVEDLIGHAIDQHVAEMHPGASQMNGDDDGGDAGGDMDMTDAEKARLKDLETEVLTLTTRATTAETRASTAESALAAFKTAPVVLTLKDGETPAAAVAREFGLTLKDGETFGQAIARVLEQNTLLLKAKVDREEADLVTDVDMAFQTYKDVCKFTDAQKPALLASARADRASFTLLYPPVAPAHAHLLSNLVPVNPRPVAEEEIVVPGFTETVRKLQAEKKLNLSDAQVEATAIVNAAARRKQASDDAKKAAQ